MNTFCTIVTPNYLAYVCALFESLKLHALGSIKMYALISTTGSEIRSLPFPQMEGIEYLFIDDLCKDGMGRKLKDKYFESDVHAFRWSMKPVLLNHLLQKENCEKVIYVDGDIFFFSDYQFLFSKLTDSRVLLTPHWRSFDPNAEPANFQLMFNSGIYNAGFIAVNKNAIPIMEWWVNACVFKCVKDTSIGFFADQTYLNLFNVMFEGVELVRHRGCNVANWNQLECKRIEQPDGQVLINGVHPIVFIHFTGSTIRGILDGTDGRLRPYLEQYSRTLQKYEPSIDILGSHQVANKVEASRSRRSAIKTYLRKWLK